MKINIHAGHNPDGKIASGAVGLIKESTQARKVKTKVISLLKEAGHTVYDCTVANGTSQSDVLNKIIKKCNAHDVDIDVSIHFNSGRNDKKGDGSIGGTEVLLYSDTSKASDEAKRVLKKINALGFKNRGIKIRKDLYYLKNTKAPAMLIECCFVDDKDDVKLFDVNKMAKAIAEGITGKSLSTAKKETSGTFEDIVEKKKNNDFKVKVTCDVLNVRKGAGTNHDVVKRIRKNEVFTIVETKGDWGKLKSGAGWINLKYTKKV